MELEDEKKLVEACGLCSNAEWAVKLTAADVLGIGRMIASVRSLPKRKQSDAWQRLTDEIEKMIVELPGDQSENLRARAIDAERKSNAMERQIRILSDALDEHGSDLERAQDREKVLEEEIRKIKAGSPPPCMYEPSSNRRVIKGPSIPLGTVHIEAGRMTLVSRNWSIPSLSPVDFVGRAFDHQEAYSILENWPMSEALTLEEFRRYGEEFVRIGDDESDGKLKCRFTMNFYIRDGVPYDMFVDEFLQYFYMQKKLTTSEFSQIQ